MPSLLRPRWWQMAAGILLCSSTVLAQSKSVPSVALPPLPAPPPGGFAAPAMPAAMPAAPGLPGGMPGMGAPGMGVPGMGMPGMGVPGMGVPGMGMMPGMPSQATITNLMGGIPGIGPMFTNPASVTKLVPDLGPFQVSGWFDYGFITNTSGPESGYNGPYNSIDQNTLMLNQAYFIFDWKLPEDGCWGVGAQADVLLGRDYWLAQSFGFELNQDGSNKWNGDDEMGLAIPQLYFETGNDIFQWKLGHFYSPIGYESLPAPNNFFYTKGYSYQFAGPFTFWGGIGTWAVTDNLTFDVGLVNTWNTLDAPSDHLNALAKATYRGENRDWYTSFGIITGPEFSNTAQLPGISNVWANRTRYSMIYSQNFGANCQWEYVADHWLGFQDQGTATQGTAWWYGLDQYLFYKISQQYKWGARVEWFRDEQGTRVGLGRRPGNPNGPPFAGNFYSITTGMNYTPYPNFTVRPEVRYDWFDGTANPYDDGQKEHQFLFGIDMITRF